MKQPARATSTQQFTQILDIREDVVLLHGGNACLVLSVQAVNFTLLSKEEQDAKVYAYAALLNSLTFPIQVLVRSRKIEIAPYLQSLEQAAQSATNTKLQESIRNYQQFVSQLVTVSTVLDKQFYIIISYSPLEEGASSAARILGSGKNLDSLFTSAKAALHIKADSLTAQIDRMALRSKILEKDALVSLFHDIYNEQGLGAHQVTEHTVAATKGVAH